VLSGHRRRSAVVVGPHETRSADHARRPHRAGRNTRRSGGPRSPGGSRRPGGPRSTPGDRGPRAQAARRRASMELRGHSRLHARGGSSSVPVGAMAPPRMGARERSRSPAASAAMVPSMARGRGPSDDRATHRRQLSAGGRASGQGVAGTQPSDVPTAFHSATRPSQLAGSPPSWSCPLSTGPS
jgi:hypothetical protein